MRPHRPHPSLVVSSGNGQYTSAALYAQSHTVPSGDSVALTSTAAPTVEDTDASRRPAQIVQCLGGCNHTPYATNTREALYALCKVAPLQPKRGACVPSMVTNVAAIWAVRQQHRPMVQASAIIMVEDTDV